MIRFILRFILQLALLYRAFKSSNVVISVLLLFFIVALNGCSERGMQTFLGPERDASDEFSVFIYKPLQMPRSYNVIQKPEI